jgi:hypothetical protein
MGEPTPLQDLVVNDRYWLGRARGMLDQSIRGRDEAAGRLTSGVGWLWTVYTGAALVGVALRNQPLPTWAVGVLVAPALLLVAAYGLAVWAGLPLDVAFDPRVVEEIQQVHEQATKEKQHRLRWAGVVAGLGALAVVTAVVVTATVRSNPSGPSLAAALHQQADGRRLVLVEGRFPPVTAVTLTVTAGQGAGGPAAQLATADKMGLIRTSIPVSPDGQKWRVQANWIDRQQRWTLTTPVADSAQPAS